MKFIRKLLIVELIALYLLGISVVPVVTGLSGIRAAHAASSLPPGPNALQRSQIAPRTNIFTSKPWGSSLTSEAASTFTLLTGSPALHTVELEDDYRAVRFRFATQTSTDNYTIDQMMVAPSSSYGPGKSPGVTPYNAALVAQQTMTVVTFNHGGACNSYSTPWANQVSGGSTDSADGYFTQSIPATNAITIGQTGALGITYQSSLGTPGSSVDQFNQFQPHSGWYVQTGNSAFPANTTITVGTGTFTPSAVPIAAIAQNQLIFFSPIAIVTTLTVPVNTSPIQQQFVCSDWIPLSSLYRNDGGITLKDVISGPGVQTGTVPTSIGPQIVGLSLPLNATSPVASQQINFTFTTTSTSPTPTNAAGQYQVNVADTSGITQGRIVGGTSIPSGTYVTYVGPGYFRMSNAPTAPIALGATLTFTATCWTYGNVAINSGDTQLNLISTNQKPILEMRIAATGVSGGTVAAYGAYSNAPLRLEGALGLPQSFVTRNATSNDYLNIIGNATNTTASGNWPSPVWAIDYIGVHKGVVVYDAGDSQYAGLTTMLGAANWARTAANSISTKQLPVAYVNGGYSGQTIRDYVPTILNLAQSLQSPIVIAQMYTNNGRLDNVWTQQGMLATMAATIYGWGGKVIFGSQGTIGMIQPGVFTLASSVSGTSGTMTDPFPYNETAIQISSGTCTVPANTTMTGTANTYNATFSNALSCPAGTTINTNLISVNAVSGSTTGTLQAPAPFTPQASIAVSCSSGCPAGLTATILQGSTSITFSTAVTIAANTVLNLGQTSNTYLTDSQTSLSLLRSMTNSGTTTFDLNAQTEDPANPTFYRVGCSFDGTHIWEQCTKNTVAPAFVPVLQGVIGTNWLLERDINPASNDNNPVGLARAA